MSFILTDDTWKFLKLFFGSFAVFSPFHSRTWIYSLTMLRITRVDVHTFGCWWYLGVHFVDLIEMILRILFRRR